MKSKHLQEHHIAHTTTADSWIRNQYRNSVKMDFSGNQNAHQIYERQFRYNWNIYKCDEVLICCYLL